MKIKWHLTLILFCASLPAYGELTFTDTYRTKVLRDLNSSQIIQSNIKSKSRSACPNATSKEMSSCFKAQLQPLEIKSASHALFLYNVALTAADLDQRDGRSSLTAALMAGDNLLGIMEKIDTRKFLLNQMTINSVEDYSAAIQLKRQENKSLLKAKTKMLSSVEKILAQTAPLQRQPSSVAPSELQAWQIAQASRLKVRYDSIKTKAMEFPKHEINFDRARIYTLILREKQRSICFNPHMTACKEMSLQICEKIAQTAYSFCDRQGARFPAQAQEQDIQTYIRDLNSCSAPNIKQALIKAAPSCHEP